MAAVVVVHWAALGMWMGSELSKVGSAVVGQGEHGVALPSTVGWARIAPFGVGKLKPGTVKMLTVDATLVVGV